MSQLAQAIVDSATASHTGSRKGSGSAALVSGRMRLALTRFAGADGFTALFRRAIRLAQIETPTWEAIKIGPDSYLSGIDQLSEAQAVTLFTCLLELLVTLIGERLTLRLVTESWPELMD